MAGRAPNPNAGHRQRLRDKYLDQGLDAFTDSEVIELLLTLATPRADTKPMARAALARFGGLRGVLEAEAAQLMEIPGLGRKNILGLKLVHDVARRFLRERLLGRDFLESPREVFDYLYHALRDKKTEAAQVIFLDARNGVMAIEEPFPGGPSNGLIDVAVILRRALEIGAAGLVLVHNHPSGRVAPSADDERVTRNLVFGAKAVGIKPVDHLIVGENRYYSFSEAGLIRRLEDEFEALNRLAP